MEIDLKKEICWSITKGEGGGGGNKTTTKKHKVKSEEIEY